MGRAQRLSVRIAVLYIRMIEFDCVLVKNNANGGYKFSTISFNITDSHRYICGFRSHFAYNSFSL